MGHSRLYSNCKGAASEYSAVASLVISLRSLNLIGIALALALYLCRENHLYHFSEKKAKNNGVWSRHAVRWTLRWFSTT